ASAQVAFGALHAAFLAMRGMTGPLNLVEGPRGLEDLVGHAFRIDWSDRSLERVSRCLIKRFNAEVHSQSALEGLLELRREHHIDAREVESVDIETFRTAREIIGGGAFGDRTAVETKEQADHS